MDGNGALGIAGIADADEIGRGGFGVVYRATEIELDRVVAVKILGGRLDQRARDRFDRERRAMGALSGHPNIVTIYRSGFTDNEEPYLMMEFLADGSVADRLDERGPLDWTEVVSYGVELCGAIETAHRAGVLHRDIKPGNILLSDLGTPKVGDFGIARLQGAPETRSAVITASVAHAAPEVVSGTRPDERSDIYSLVSTLYELMTGSPAFSRPDDESLVPLLARIAQDPPPDLRPNGVPDEVCSVLEAAMAKDRDNRPTTAAELGRELAAAQARTGRPVTPMQIVGEPRVAPIAPTSLSHALTADAVVAPTPAPSPPVVAPTAPDPPRFVAAPPPAATSPPPAPRPSPPTPNRATPAIAIAALGAVALVVAIVFALGRGNETADPPTTTTTTDPVGTTPETTTTVGVVTVSSELPQATAEDYPDYQSVSDSNSAISIAVPAAWTDLSTGTGIVTVAPAIADAFGSFRGPGAQVSAFVNPSGLSFSPDILLDGLSELACGDGTRIDYDDGRLSGRAERFRNCGSTGASVVHLALAPPDRSFVVTVSLQFLTPQDETAANAVISSLFVDGTRL